MKSMIDLLDWAKILLKATKDLLEKQENSYYVLDLLFETVFYDGSECDGYCLKDEIGYWLDQLEDQEKLSHLIDKVEKRDGINSREEAIERIKTFLEECAEEEDELTYVTSYDADALHVAIKSLEQDPCEDCVSRQAVLNTLNNADSVLDNDRTVETYKELLVACYNDLPPVTPTPKWFACSERLPEENGRYLVTRGLNACGSLWNRVYIVNYSDLMGLKKEKIWWSGNVGKSDFERYDDVLAWMSLPASYQGE